MIDLRGGYKRKERELKSDTTLQLKTTRLKCVKSRQDSRTTCKWFKRKPQTKKST